MRHPEIPLLEPHSGPAQQPATGCLPSTHLPAPGVQNHHLGLTPQAGHRQVAANPAKCSTLHSSVGPKRLVL